MNEPLDPAALADSSRPGPRAVLDALLPRVYDELHRMAHRQLAGERSGHTLNTTDLVHEAYVKLAAIERIQVQNRPHFFALAGRAMRRVLVDHAVRRGAQKRGGEQVRVTLDTSAAAVADRDVVEILDLDDALQRLESINERYGRVVECRFFAGMNVEETAAALGVSVATIYRDWNFARAWLNRELLA